METTTKRSVTASKTKCAYSFLSRGESTNAAEGRLGSLELLMSSRHLLSGNFGSVKDEEPSIFSNSNLKQL